MAVTLEKIYEVALNNYNMQLKSGSKGLSHLVDWVHIVEEMDYIHFLKGRELIVTTGIVMPTDEILLTFVKNICEAGASGLVINIGRYIKRIPEKVIAFSNTHNFPVFVLPWEVHLVDFNRELCNLIYQDEREQDNMESAIKKLIFSKEDKESSLQVLGREGIAPDATVRLLQCYLPILEQENLQDITQFKFQFQRYCQQILAATKKKYVFFYEDSCGTIVLFDMEELQIKEIIDNIQKFQSTVRTQEQMYYTVSGSDTTLSNLWEKYKKALVLCKRIREEGNHVCKEDEEGVWKLLLDIEDPWKLKGYAEKILGDLIHIDEETGTEYCRILELYLEENGNIQEVASKSFLHRNTVSTYLKKIAEITGKNLSDVGDRTELYLAFQLKKILQLL